MLQAVDLRIRPSIETDAHGNPVLRAQLVLTITRPTTRRLQPSGDITAQEWVTEEQVYSADPDLMNKLVADLDEITAQMSRFEALVRQEA